MNCAVHAQQGNIEQVLKEYGLCGNEHTQVVLLHINKTLHSYLTRTYFKKNLHLHSKVISNKCSKSTGCAAMKIHKLCHTFRFTPKALARKIAKWISAKMLWCVCVCVSVCVCVCVCVCGYRGVSALLDGYCCTVQGLLDSFEVDLGFPELVLFRFICVSVCLCVCVCAFLRVCVSRVCVCVCVYMWVWGWGWGCDWVCV